MNVKSLITWPQRGRVLPAGPVEVRGVAWTGAGACHQGRGPDRPGRPMAKRDAARRPRARELAAMAARAGALAAGTPRPRGPGDRLDGPGPARIAGVEQERVSLERLRCGRLRGPLTAGETMDKPVSHNAIVYIEFLNS